MKHTIEYAAFTALFATFSGAGIAALIHFEKWSILGWIAFIIISLQFLVLVAVTIIAGAQRIERSMSKIQADIDKEVTGV